MMKTRGWIAALAAAAALPGLPQAAAETYTVAGMQTGFGFNPPPPVTPKITDTPASPTFTGSWSVAADSLSGVIAFAPYKVEVKAMLFKAELDFAKAEYRIDGGTITYDPATLTLKLTDGRLRYIGKVAECKGSSMICDSQPNPDMERFEVTLTFTDATLGAFQGRATAVNHGGSNGNSFYNYTFNGRAPATAPASGSSATESDMAALARQRTLN